MKSTRILVIARGHLGDLVTALPALRDLRRAYPNAHIAALVNEYVYGGLEGCPFVNEVIYGFAYTRRGLLGRLRQMTTIMWRVLGRYDVVVSLRSNPRFSAVIALLSGARTRVGFEDPGLRAKLLTHHLGAQPDMVNTRVLNCMPVGALGVDTNPAYPTIDWISAAVRDQTTRLLEESGVGQSAFAVLQLSSNWGCNEWSAKKWAAIADYLAVRHGLKVLTVGTGDRFERAKFDEVRRLMRQDLISLHGKTSLKQLFDIVQRASLVLACDSALTQIALAQRAPSVILFGIEPLEENGPLPEEAQVLMEPVQHWEGRDRAPAPNPHCRFGESYCHTQFCQENSSLRETHVEEVMTRVDLLMARSLADRRITSLSEAPIAVVVP
jgi:heptosyltransferase-2